jgi:hypothetical protein
MVGQRNYLKSEGDKQRAELTALERDVQVARWIELTVAKQAEV